MDTFPLVYPHVLGECQIQPAEPDELGLMPQGGDHSSTVFIYPCDKHRSDREDRVAAICAVYQSTYGSERNDFQLDQHWGENSGIFDDDWL